MYDIDLKSNCIKVLENNNYNISSVDSEHFYTRNGQVAVVSTYRVRRECFLDIMPKYFNKKLSRIYLLDVEFVEHLEIATKVKEEYMLIKMYIEI